MKSDENVRKLSDENVRKLCMTGIYICDPVLSWQYYKGNNLYHCVNWVFTVHKDVNNYYYMLDTYFGGHGGLVIKLNDGNIGHFVFLFDMNEVRRVSESDFYDYDEGDRWSVPGDYGFSTNYFVRKDARKIGGNGV